MSRRSAGARGLAAGLIAWLVLGSPEIAWATPSPTPAGSGAPQSATPHPYDRVDRVRAGLAKNHLFVDPDLDFALDTAQRARISAALRSAERQIGAPVYVVVIPNAAGADPHGRTESFLFDLHDRMRQRGLYVLADEMGYVVDLPFEVHRHISSVSFFDDAGKPADIHKPFADLPDRLVNTLDALRNAPSAEPTEPGRDTSPPSDTKPPKVHFWSNFFLGLLVAGPVAALLLYWMGRLLETVAGRFRPQFRTGPVPDAHPDAPTQPTARWLHRTATRELERLGAAISADPSGAGRAYAMSAYDAGAILTGDLDSAGSTEDDDAERILDLVGVIVLARLGRAALARGTDRPAPPCYVNPLHGPSDGRTRVNLPEPYRSGEKRPLCRRCWGRTSPERRADLLTVPGPHGPRVYITVPGFWSETGFGTYDLIPRLLEHLGVDD
ncbi:MAG: hypothetical protein JWN52_4821 [Actinomycetia bacterium]|nr:hypothetical protein [Actinomycetes bacterium]